MENESHQIARCDRNGPIPLSFGQQRLWFVEQLLPSKLLYNQYQAFRLLGELNVSALSKAFSTIVRRHEAIRTSIAFHASAASQIIRPAVPITVPVVDLREVRDIERQSVVEEQIRELASRRFDLTTDILLRPCVLQLADQDHVLAWSMHHIATDGWSMNLLRSELNRFYSAYCRGESPAEDELEFQYADFAVWQRQNIQGTKLEELLDFWRGELAGIPETLALPTDRPRTDEPRFRGRRVYFEIPGSITNGLRQLARQQRVTPYMVLVAAFQVLVFRYTHQRAFAIGSPIAGRTQQQFENCIGLFINLFALKARFEDGISFADHLRNVRNCCLGAYQHQDLPFEMLVDGLDPQRSLARHPIVQIMFALQSGTNELELGDLQTERLHLAGQATQFELEIYLRDEQSLISGICDYDRDLWDQPTIQRLFDHYLKILGHVIDDPDQPIDLIPLMSPTERHQIANLWSEGGSLGGPFVPVHRTIEQICADHPNSIAVRFEDQVLTYRQLNERSNRLANYLVSRGLTDGAHVAVCLDRSLEPLICLFAILKAGAVYVPLDPREPEARQSFIANDADLDLVICQDAATVDRSTFGCPILDLSDSDVEFAGQSECNLSNVFELGSLAYLFYTSGSTGDPKGVMVEHRSLAWFLRAMAERPGLTADDRLLSVTATTFDISLLEFLLPLTVGSQLEIVGRNTARDGTALREKLSGGDFTVMQATPTTWQMLLAANWEGQSSLKILSGGEPMQENLAAQLIPRCRELWNMYGPTETTIWSTAQRIEAPQDSKSIGRPIPGTLTYVLDANRQLLPIGVPGELVIGGQGVARGYHARPELTAERFIADPIQPGQRLYRTGDRVRWRNDGTLEFLGRFDSQIKLRGHRIELGEIESVLSSHPAVQQCVAVLSPDKLGEARIVAYVVMPEHPSIDQDAWQEFMRQRLPSHMIPAAFVQLAELPLTSGGKADRRLLADREVVLQNTTPRVAQTLTPMQTLVADIWKGLLSRGELQIDDDFFKIGGNSLLAMHAIAELQRRLQIEVPVRRLFESPTLRAFASVIDELMDGRNRTEASVDAVDRFDYLEVLREGDCPVAVVWVGQLHGHEQLMNAVLPRSSLCWLKMEGLHTDHFRDRSVRERARLYADELLRRFPDHRFVVSGFCLSAMYAHGLAQELRARGTDVASLVGLEPMVPWLDFKARQEATSVDATAAGNELARSIASHETRAQQLVQIAQLRSRVAADRLLAMACRFVGRPIPVHARWHYYFRWLRGAAKAYEVAPFDGGMVIIGRRQYLDRWGGVWKKYVTGELQTLALDTMDHFEIFQPPYDETWGAWLNEHLSEILHEKSVDHVKR